MDRGRLDCGAVVKIENGAGPNAVRGRRQLLLSIRVQPLEFRKARETARSEPPRAFDWTGRSRKGGPAAGTSWTRELKLDRLPEDAAVRRPLVALHSV